MSYLSNVNLDHSQISLDAGARVRVSQITTLGDYKVLNFDRPLLIEMSGSGTGSFVNNKIKMEVSSSQYIIRQTKQFHTYSSGKSQLIEVTFDNFHTESGIDKKVGYFSSNAAAPFSSSYDGFYLQSSASNYYLVAQRNGVPTLFLSQSQWSGYSNVQGQDWSKFNVVLFDFLWLGGAVLRVFVKGATDFQLAHIFNYAGTSQDTFIASPNQPIRYELRSTGSVSSGSFRYICSQIATEGSINESGVSRGFNSGTASISLTTIGTKYPLKAIRKSGSFRDIPVAIEDIGIFVSSSSDTLLWTLEVNPIMSAPLTYTAVPNSAIMEATGSGTITVTTAGTIIANGIVTTGVVMPTSILQRNFMSYLGGTLTNTMDEYVLCATPLTPAIATYSYILTKEF